MPLYPASRNGPRLRIEPKAIRTVGKVQLVKFIFGIVQIRLRIDLSSYCIGGTYRPTKLWPSLIFMGLLPNASRMIEADQERHEFVHMTRKKRQKLQPHRSPQNSLSGKPELRSLTYSAAARMIET